MQFKIPSWLVAKIKSNFSDQPAILIEMSNNPEKLTDLLLEAAKTRFLPQDIMKSIDDGKVSLLYLQAQAADEKWKTFKNYTLALSKYNEKMGNLNHV